MVSTGPMVDTVLLAGCGVLTAMPSLLFPAAANRVSLTVFDFVEVEHSPLVLFLLHTGASV